MLLKKAYYIIGLQLLLLMHISYSFVLLTANIEDVKRLANKFVSKSMAEQIAAFFTKATEQIINVSAENEMNVDKYPYESNENTGGPSLTRQGKTKKEEAKKDFNEKKTIEFSIQRNSKDKEYPIEKIRKPDKENQAPKKERNYKNSHPEPLKPRHETKNYVYLTFTLQDSRKDKHKQKTVSQTSQFYGIKNFHRKTTLGALRQNHHKSSLQVSDDDKNTLDKRDMKKPNDDTDFSDSSSGVNDVNKQSNVATKKNKLRMHPIGTSGPVSLPKADMKTFWKQELDVRMGKRENY